MTNSQNRKKENKTTPEASLQTRWPGVPAGMTTVGRSAKRSVGLKP